MFHFIILWYLIFFISPPYLKNKYILICLKLLSIQVLLWINMLFCLYNLSFVIVFRMDFCLSRTENFMFEMHVFINYLKLLFLIIFLAILLKLIIVYLTPHFHAFLFHFYIYQFFISLHFIPNIFLSNIPVYYLLQAYIIILNPKTFF